MFASKKEAEAYDKMLELAEGFATLIQNNFNSVSEEDAEAIGLLLSKHKQEIIAACKGNTEQLMSLTESEGQSSKEKSLKKPDTGVVTPIKSKG